MMNEEEEREEDVYLKPHQAYVYRVHFNLTRKAELTLFCFFVKNGEETGRRKEQAAMHKENG